MKSKTMVLALVATGLTVPSAFSQQIVTSDSRNFTFTETLGNNVLTLDQFDDQGGNLTLTSVILTIQYNVPSQTLRLDNDADGTATGDFSFGEFGSDGFFASVSTLNDSFASVSVSNFNFTTQSQNFSLDADEGAEGVGTLDIQPGEGDYFQFQTTAANLGVTGWEINPLVFSQYTGNGSITIDLAKAYSSAITNLILNGSGDLEQGSTTTTGTFSASITYNYVPEPSAALLGGLGLLALLRRRR